MIGCHTYNLPQTPLPICYFSVPLSSLSFPVSPTAYLVLKLITHILLLLAICYSLTMVLYLPYVGEISLHLASFPDKFHSARYPKVPSILLHIMFFLSISEQYSIYMYTNILIYLSMFLYSVICFWTHGFFSRFLLL